MLFAALLLAGASFQTPLPLPDLVDQPPDAIFAALGEPGRVVKGDDAKKICSGACDEIRVYGPETAPPELTTASAFVYLKSNRVTNVKWIFPGKLAKPDSYPRFGRVFEDGYAPFDLEELEAHDPITIENATDATRRKVAWVHRGWEWTALVLTPLVREVSGADLYGTRKALPEEWRVVLVEAGPLRVERKKIACDPTGETPYLFHPGDPIPRPKKQPPMYDFRGEIRSPAIVDIEVGADGKVTSAKLVRGPESLGVTAVDGMEKSRFEPFLCEGKPIPWKGRTAVMPAQ